MFESGINIENVYASNGKCFPLVIFMKQETKRERYEWKESTSMWQHDLEKGTNAPSSPPRQSSSDDLDQSF